MYQISLSPKKILENVLVRLFPLEFCKIFQNKSGSKKPLPSYNFNINNKNVIPSTYILVFNIQIKTRCVKWLK